MRGGSFILVLSAVLAVPAWADEPDAGAPVRSGIDGLCAGIAERLKTALPGNPLSLSLSAEGAAVDIAEPVRTRCAALIDALPVAAPSSAPRAVVHVTVRVSPPSLTALVSGGATPEETWAVSVPMGAALESWLAAGGHGVETWLVGSVEGSVLALCGANGTLVVVTPTQVGFLKWGWNGLTPLARLDLPVALRARARAPAATAICRASAAGLTVALGVHDRGKGVVVKFENGAATWTTPLDGVPIGFKEDATPILAAGDNATNLLKWGERSFAQAMLLGSTAEAPVLGTTASGALVKGGTVGEAGTFGTGFAAADLDRDGVVDLVVTRPVFAGAGVEDRLSVRTVESPLTVVHESRPVKGLLGALGTMVEGDWVRVVAAQPGVARTQLFAVGLRQPPGSR